MANYTFSELTDMLFAYGKTDFNGNAAQRLYAERFPTRQRPGSDIFRRLTQRMRETGSVKPRRINAGAPRNCRSPATEEEVLSEIANNPRTSIRKISQKLGISYGSTWRTLHNESYHPYHLQKVQTLSCNDFGPRVTFCNWLLQNIENRPDFVRNILFTDEASFQRENYWNSHNSHVWDIENPHAISHHGSQNRFSVNVWAGIINGQLIGPYVLPPYLNGEVYLRFLRDVLPELLEDVPLHIRQNMWLQHDGAPAHFSINVREYLDGAFEGRWIGRGGPVLWPPRSPDLTPLDFFLWGHIKSLIYDTPVESQEDLYARISVAAEEIRNTPGIFERVYNNIPRRCNTCIEVGGRQFEQLL